jgi:hypothetical protein
MKELTQAPNHHNGISLFSSYAFSSILGGDLDDFMIYWTDSICCASVTTPAPLGDRPPLDDDARSDLVDPEALQYQREMRAVADLDDEYDMESCDSSISSTGSMVSCRERNRVRVFFDASFATAVVQEPVP